MYKMKFGTKVAVMALMMYTLVLVLPLLIWN
jgi:hypothetical protein